MLAEPHRVRGLRVLIGCSMAAAGSATLVVLIVMSYDPSSSLDLGLASTVLLSATAQVALLIGGWLAWTGISQRKRQF
jgi:hypothetical protein